MKRFFAALCVSAALCFAVSFMLCPAYGQVLSGSLTGTVVDQTGASVPGASVTATDADTGKVFKETADAKGEFTFTNVPNGFYKVVVEHAGFAKFTVERVQVFVSQSARVTAKLEIATAGTEVVVSAVQATVQADSVELKNSVERAQLDSMPLPTRNPLDLVKTFAGILTPNVAGVTGGDAFVHGLRGATTDITQDGIDRKSVV